MLTPETVVAPREKSYFTVAIILAVLAWLLLTLITVGFVWVFLGIMAVVVWFSNGLLVASLRADAVEVHPKQLGRLDATFRDVCATLGLSTIPELYIIQSGGALNAFATRHTGRHFVVIYSDMLEAFGPDSKEMRFLLGHEIGHIHRNHLMMRLLLAPALFLPLIGAAYSRSCESTCDRYGALAAGDIDASMRAMMTVAGGKAAAREMDPHHFADQHHNRRGFFVSWYELVSGYPTLSRRVRDLRALAGERPEPAAPRNPLAYLFALVTFGGGFGGRGSILSMIFVIYFLAILLSLLIPGIGQALKAAESAKLQEIEEHQTLERSRVEAEEFQDGSGEWEGR